MIMKQFFNHALLGAIALTGAVCFSACSSDDIEESINPTFDPVTNTVKANFSLALTSSLKANAGAQTRMGENETQVLGFNGIKNINLIPFDCVEEISNAKTRVGTENVLTNVTISSSESHLNAKSGSYNYHYLDVLVPVGTGSFLFYGLAGNAIDPTNTEATAAQKFQNGILTPAGTLSTENPAGNLTDGNPADFHFDLVPIHTNTGLDEGCTNIINYLTAIASAHDSENNYWSASTDDLLKHLYEQFVSMPAGSAASVRKVVQDLYQNIYNRTDAISIAIVEAIKTGATENTTGGETPTKTGTLTFTNGMSEASNTYPRNINLPDGAAVITWTAGATATGPKVPSAVTTGSREKAIASLNSYVFPPSLYYFANSLIRVSTSKKDNEYASKSSWTDILGTYDAYTDGSKTVGGNTRDIALQKEIQYGVGRMELTVKASDARDGSNQTAEGGPDNSASKVLLDRKGKEVVIPAGGFPVTGVLIGTQRNADWNFKPVAAVTSGTAITNEYTVYDRNVTGVYAKAGAADGSNHTLVIESDAGDVPVYIAVELENTSGSSFEGYQGIVPAGAKFYLAAELKPTAGTQPAGVTGIDQVFIQDYHTNVNLTISPNTVVDSDGETYSKGLGAAYNVIPDLGTPSLRLGFSVDLSWTLGLTFNIDL